jgi:hypothetical protein
MVIKGAKEDAKGISPSFASPEATPTKFCSAIPTFINRFEKVDLNLSRPDELPRSADNAIRFG